MVKAGKLKGILTRQNPPGLILQVKLYDREIWEDFDLQEIDLPDLNPNIDLDNFTRDIISSEPLLSDKKFMFLKKLLSRLIDKIFKQQFYDQRSLIGHTKALTSCRFSSDGSFILTSSEDGTCRLWDAISGDQKFLLAEHSKSVHDAQFSPIGDLRIVTVSADTSGRIWSVDNGECIHVLQGHKAEVTCVAWHPEGSFVCTGANDNLCIVWDVVYGSKVSYLHGHSAPIASLSFNKCGNRILTGSLDYNCRVWEPKSGRYLHALSYHENKITKLCFDFTGEYVATCSSDKTCRLWHFNSGVCLEVFRDYKSRVTDAAFSPEGGRIAIASADATARIYDIRELKLVDPNVASTDEPTPATILAVCIGHSLGITKLCWAPNGYRIFTASHDNTIKIWSADTGECVQTLSGHRQALVFAHAGSDGKSVVTASKDTTAKLWRDHVLENKEDATT